MQRRRVVAGLAGVALLVVVTGGMVVMRIRSTSASGVLRTVTLSGFLNTMVIDPRTSRAFISAWSDSGRTSITMLDTASGTLLRTVATGSGNSNPGNIAIDAPIDRVFVTNPGDETMRVLDARTGSPVGTVVVGYMVGGRSQSIVVDTHTGRVFVWASGLRMLDARSGAILHTLINMGDDLALDEQTGRVFVADSIAGTVNVVDAGSGNVVRTLALGPHPRVLANAATGRVVVIGDTTVHLLDARTGQLLHTMSLGSRVGWDPHALVPVTASPTSPVVVISPIAGSGHLILVDARTGRIKRTAAVVGQAGDVPVLDGRTGHIFVAGTSSATSGDGRVWMIDARSGALLRTITIDPNPSSIVVDERIGRVLVTSSGVFHGNVPTVPGSVSVIDARSGALLRTVPVGMNPGLLAVDERTGHAFIATYGGPVPVSDPWGWVPSWLRRRLPFLHPPASATRMVPVTVSMIDVAR